MRFYTCIHANGTVFPCIGGRTKVIGDLNKQSIREVWEDNEEMKRLRDIK